MCSVLNALSEYTYFYVPKIFIHTLSCLFLKSSKHLSLFWSHIQNLSLKTSKNYKKLEHLKFAKF